MQSMLRPTCRSGAPYLASIRIPAKNGSHNVPFSHDLIRRTLACAYTTASDQQDAIVAVGAALKAFEPSDEIEAMIGAQVIAAHYASIHCFTSARDPNLPPERRGFVGMLRTYPGASSTCSMAWHASAVISQSRLLGLKKSLSRRAPRLWSELSAGEDRSDSWNA